MGPPVFLPEGIEKAEPVAEAEERGGEEESPADAGAADGPGPAEGGIEPALDVAPEHDLLAQPAEHYLEDQGQRHADQGDPGFVDRPGFRAPCLRQVEAELVASYLEQGPG